MKGGETDMRHTQGKRGREMSMEKGRGATVRVGQRDVRVLREVADVRRKLTQLKSLDKQLSTGSGKRWSFVLPWFIYLQGQDLRVYIGLRKLTLSQ